MRTRMRGVAAALTVSALCLTAVACEGSSDDKKPAKTEAGKPEAGKPEAGKTEPTTSEAPAVTPLTAAQMKAATLEAKDLPPGWKASKAEPSKDDPKADKPECQPIAGVLADKIAGATIGGDMEFERGGGDSSLAQQVFTFPGTGAADYLKPISTALGACTGFSFEMEGMKADVKLAKLTAPQAGEEALAFRFKMAFPEMAGFKIEMNLLVARQGTGVTRLAHVPANASGHKDFDGLAKLAGDKFTKAAQG
ncbi:hypothetical protein [Streptomyces sp. NPDC019890]|uniref:hypothetical protein n=1 Tax=Streptomyces sp. NPDC019890 TaxID=3365064 RepID=UPI00384D48F5